MVKEAEEVYSLKFHRIDLCSGLIWRIYIDFVCKNISFQHFCIEVLSQILPNTSTDGEVLWPNLPIPFQQSEYVGLRKQ